METHPDLPAIMAAKSEDELLAVLTNPDDYLAEAPAAAATELGKRKLSAEQGELLRGILERSEAQSQELCPHCLRPTAFEVFSICAHCGQDKNAVRFPCPKCSAILEAPRISAGSWKSCSECGTNVPVPPETAEALLIESDEPKELHEAILQRLHAALVKVGRKESEWGLTFVELVNLPPEKLVDHLRSRKIETTLARAGARAIRELGPGARKEMGRVIDKNIVWGGFVLGFGLLATLMSFSTAARSGGTFWIFYGAIFVGTVQLLIGLKQDRRRRLEAADEVDESYTGPRCVACAAPIETGAKTCPQCGWTQPV